MTEKDEVGFSNVDIAVAFDNAVSVAVAAAVAVAVAVDLTAAEWIKEAELELMETTSNPATNIRTNFIFLTFFPYISVFSGFIGWFTCKKMDLNRLKKVNSFLKELK